MATLTIRNVPPDTHQKLRMRAARNGRSVEEEVRQILAEKTQGVVSPPATEEELMAAVRRAQELFAPMRKRYSVDKFIAEKRTEARAEFAEGRKKFRK